MYCPKWYNSSLYSTTAPISPRVRDTPVNTSVSHCTLHRNCQV